MMNMIARWADDGGVKLDTGRMSALAQELETLLDNAQNEQVDLALVRPCARRTGR